MEATDSALDGAQGRELPSDRVADLVEYIVCGLVDDQDAAGNSLMTMISAGTRSTQLSPEETTACVDGIPRDTGEALLVDRGGLTPVWPLGLAVQVGLVAVLMVVGHRRLKTPAGSLPRGLRIA